MGVTTVGVIGLDMILNSTQFRKQMVGIQSQANIASQKIANSFKKVGVALATTFSAAAITAFGKSCIDLGSDLAEVQNVVDVTFTSMSDKVNQWALNAKNAYGLSETMAKKYVGAFGSMASAFGFTEEKSYSMATALAGLTGDVASFYNLTQDVAYTKLKSVFSGETESLKDLGVVMTQSALDSYAIANGYGKVTSAMTEAEKVTLRYNFMLNQLKNANGDFARTQNSWANQTKVLQLRFEGLKATIGQGLINAFTPVIKVVNSLIDRLTTVSEKFRALTEQIFGSAGGTSAGTVENLTDEANASSSALDGVAVSAEKAKRSVAGFDKLNVLTKSETDSSNEQSSVQTTSNGNTLASAMSKSVDNLALTWNTKGQRTINSIKTAFNSVKDAVKSIGKSWSTVWNNGTGERVINNIKNLLENCISNIGYIADSFKKAWDKAGLGNSVVQSIIDRADSLLGLIDTIAEDFGKVWNSGVGERIWTNILTIIRNCNDSVTTLREKIKLAWEKGGTGEKIWNTILGIVEDITGFFKDMSGIRLEWLENLDLSPLVTAVSNLGEAFRKLLNACGDKLKEAYKKVLLPLAEWTIEKGIPKLVELLSDALSGIAKVVKNIDEKVLYAIAGGIAAVGTAVVVFKTGSAIAAGINKVKNAISLLGTAISAHPLLAIASAIGGIVVAVQTYNELEWSNSQAKKFADEIDAIESQIEETTTGITDTLESTLDTLDGMYADNTLIDDYQKKLETLISKARLTPDEQSQLQTIVTYFNNNVTGFDETWKKYIEISDGGKVELKDDLDEVQGAIKKTIDEYQRLANSTALQELMSENSKSIITANKEVGEQLEQIKTMEGKLASVESSYEAWLNKKGISRTAFESAGFNRSDALYSEGKDYYDQIKELKSGLAEVKVAYGTATAEADALQQTNKEMSGILNVLNGDYTNAVAVLMAYENGFISLQDVQNSEWKTLENLTKVAESSGENLVLGLAKGTKKYADEVNLEGTKIGTDFLDAFDKTMNINSPSIEMEDRGVWIVQGLINGLKKMYEKLKNTFQGMWNVIKQPLNIVMSNLEKFINGFIGAINKLSSGADWAINSIGQIFGQEWHVGKLDKVTLPRFAKGGIVKAPTLAVVGDNAGANTGDPEVISPLSKLQGMINKSSGQDVVILTQILDYLKRIYEMFVIFRNQGGNTYEFVAKINGSEIFDEIVKQNELYKKRHNGKSAFA